MLVPAPLIIKTLLLAFLSSCITSAIAMDSEGYDSDAEDSCKSEFNEPEMVYMGSVTGSIVQTFLHQYAQVSDPLRKQILPQSEIHEILGNPNLIDYADRVALTHKMEVWSLIKFEKEKELKDAVNVTIQSEVLAQVLTARSRHEDDSTLHVLGFYFKQELDLCKSIIDTFSWFRRINPLKTPYLTVSINLERNACPLPELLDSMGFAQALKLSDDPPRENWVLEGLFEVIPED